MLRIDVDRPRLAGCGGLRLENQVACIRQLLLVLPVAQLDAQLALTFAARGPESQPVVLLHPRRDRRCRIVPLLRTSEQVDVNTAADGRRAVTRDEAARRSIGR